MLAAEARWLRQELKRVPDHQLFPLLNVGSHTAGFRRYEQPWIEQEVFGPLRGRRGRVIHTDLRDGKDVDLVGDLTDAAFIQQLRGLGIKSALCCNVLEHIQAIDPLCRGLVSLVPPDGRLFVTVPYRFPFHPDPIDTMFRPTPETLAAHFPQMKVERAAIVDAGTLVTYVISRFMRHPLALLGDAAGRSTWRAGDVDVAVRGESLLPWLTRRFAVTCLLLTKRP